MKGDGICVVMGTGPASRVEKMIGRWQLSLLSQEGLPRVKIPGTMLTIDNVDNVDNVDT